MGIQQRANPIAYLDATIDILKKSVENAKLGNAKLIKADKLEADRANLSDEEKKQLALFLAENLGGKVSSPEDAILEVSDEEFINYVYNAILGRGPDDDDFNLRLMELKRGKTRQELITEILESRESSRRMVSEIAKSIKNTNGS